MMPEGIIDFMRGGTMVACLGVAAYFFSFWRKTDEPLLVFFCAAFVIIGLSQATGYFLGSASDELPVMYGIRLLGFLLILMGIISKNLPQKSAVASDTELTKEVGDGADLSDN